MTLKPNDKWDDILSLFEVCIEESIWMNNKIE